MSMRIDMTMSINMTMSVNCGRGGHMSMGMNGNWDTDGNCHSLLDGDRDSSDDGLSDGLLHDDLLINWPLDYLKLRSLNNHGLVHKDLLRHEDGPVNVLVYDDLAVDGKWLVHHLDNILLDLDRLDLLDDPRDSVVLVVLSRGGVRGKGISSVDRGNARRVARTATKSNRSSTKSN